MSEVASQYGRADRLFHWLALGLPALAELSFDLDQKACAPLRDRASVAVGRHVFVSGLARAGTTVLLQALHETGAFRSLRYRDMPFPLAPNVWKRVSRRWQVAAVHQERAHGDRIATSVESPEALEQVFWRIFAGGDYIRKTALVPHEPSAETLARFQDYVGAVLASGEPGQGRYLSKNNNNILRLPSLHAAFPQARFLVPFRDPRTHAASLLRQHRHFCAVQKATPFVRRYMDWLVHHEFGLGHRPFRFADWDGTQRSPEEPDYWLALWVEVHEALAGLEGERLRFVCHEDLCRDPMTWDVLVEDLDLPREGKRAAFVLASGREGPSFSPALVTRAREVYEALRARARPGPG